MDTRNLLSLSGVLLVLGAAGYYWGIGHEQETVLGPNEKRRPDYVVTGISSRETDEQGLVMRRLEAPMVRHYDKPLDEAEIDRPVITLYEKGQEAWQITAARGSSLAQNTELRLEGGVHAQRRDPAAVALTLDTEMLWVFPREERLSSPATVTINSPQGRLSSQGVEARMKTGELILNEKVTGNYAPAPR